MVYNNLPANSGRNRNSHFHYRAILEMWHIPTAVKLLPEGSDVKQLVACLINGNRYAIHR